MTAPVVSPITGGDRKAERRDPRKCALLLLRHYLPRATVSRRRALWVNWGYVMVE